jgi:hypothetical protein
MPRTISPDAVVMDDQRLGSKHRQEAVIMDAEWTEGVAEVSLAEGTLRGL